MNSLQDLNDVIACILHLLKEDPIKDQIFDKTIYNFKQEIVNNTITYLILKKKNHLLDKININENIQHLYIKYKESTFIDCEYDKKYKVELEIEKINKLIEIIKDL
jgi:hypothetical protein